MWKIDNNNKKKNNKKKNNKNKHHKGNKTDGAVLVRPPFLSRSVWWLAKRDFGCLHKVGFLVAVTVLPAVLFLRCL